MYKNPISEIIPNKLFLGNLNDAFDDKLIKGKGITTIITIMKIEDENIEQFKLFMTENNIKNYIFDIDNNLSEDLNPLFLPIFNIIESNDIVLIHCLMGQSRSSSLTISYLMMKYNINLIDSTKIVLKNRNYIFPNDNFIKQLFNLEFKLHGVMSYGLDKNGIRYYKKLLQFS